MQLLLSGNVSKEEADLIITRYSKYATTVDSSDTAPDPLCRQVQEKEYDPVIMSMFPDSGRRIAELIGLILGNQFALREKIPGIEIIIRRAPYWTKDLLKGISYVTEDRIAQVANLISPQVNFKDKDIWVQSRPSLLEQTLLSSMRDNEAMRDELFSKWFHMSEFTAVPEVVKKCIFSIMTTMLYISCNYGKSALFFKPIIDLWIIGNMPIGMDQEGRMIVAAAEYTKNIR